MSMDAFFGKIAHSSHQYLASVIGDTFEQGKNL